MLQLRIEKTEMSVKYPLERLSSEYNVYLKDRESGFECGANVELPKKRKRSGTWCIKFNEKLGI